MSSAIALKGVHKQYDGFALRDIQLELPVGQVMGLVGVNGAGTRAPPWRSEAAEPLPTSP